MSSFAHILRTRNIQKQGRLYLGNATASRYKLRENTCQKGAYLSGKRSRYANTKQLKGRKEGRGDCGSMQTMFYRADIFLPAQDSDETIINRCRCCVQFNRSCISNQPREKVLISLEKTFQASSLQIGCNNSKNLDLTSDPPAFAGRALSTSPTAFQLLSKTQPFPTISLTLLYLRNRSEFVNFVELFNYSASPASPQPPSLTGRAQFVHSENFPTICPSNVA